MRYFLIMLFMASTTSHLARADTPVSPAVPTTMPAPINYELDPNNGIDQWRFVPHIGWRKFATIDAYYYDWSYFRRMSRWGWPSW